MWSPNELLKTEKQRDILSYITLQFFPFKKVPLEHYPLVPVILLFFANSVLYFPGPADFILLWDRQSSFLQKPHYLRCAPYQQQGHNYIHSFIMLAVELLQHISRKGPNQVSDGTHPHQIKGISQQSRR